MKFYIVLDFEATCDSTVLSPQEIIEFSFVLWEPETDECSEFQEYVKPVLHPRLTSFCTQLTGITQSQVDQACEFPQVYQHVQRFLYEHGVNADNSIVVTCGNWDIQTMLPSQCALSGVRLTRVLKQFTSVQSWSGLDDSRNLLQLVKITHREKGWPV